MDEQEQFSITSIAQGDQPKVCYLCHFFPSSADCWADDLSKRFVKQQFGKKSSFVKDTMCFRDSHKLT